MRFQTPTEAPGWSATADGKPCILFNAVPDLRTACLAAGAVEGSGLYTFSRVSQAKEAAALLGFQLPDLEERSLNFSVQKGKVVAVAERKKKETPPGWATTKRRLSVSFALPHTSNENYDFDHIVRHVRNNDDGIDKDGGFVVKARNGRWAPASDGRAVSVLMGLEMSGAQERPSFSEGCGPSKCRPGATCACTCRCLSPRPKKTMLAATRRQSEEKEGRRTLLQAMIAFTKDRGKWKGTAEQLIVALGPSHGEWSSIVTHFGRQLNKIKKELRKKKVAVTRKRRGDQRIIVIAEVAA